MSSSFGRSSQRYWVASARSRALSSRLLGVIVHSIVGHGRHAGDARWERLFAARTRGDVGDGIAAVLAFLGLPDIISFAGGFPDPLTFPRERAAALLPEFAAAGESAAFQYAPTRGLAGRSTRSRGGSRRCRAGARRTTSS